MKSKVMLSSAVIALVAATAAHAQDQAPAPSPETGAPSTRPRIVPGSSDPLSPASPAAPDQPVPSAESPIGTQPSVPTGATQQVGLADIVVTARRRAENLQVVPVTVSAFNNDTLKARGVADTAQLAQVVPNVVFDNTSSFSGAASAFQAFIRGIGQSDFAINTDPGVGVYVDGVYIARTVGAVTDLLDVASVEVLKGPQGTLFGRNTIGGALNVTTRDPGRDFAFRGTVQYGRFNQVRTGGTLDIPIADDLGAIVSFITNNQDGYQDRITFPGAAGQTGAQLGQILTADKNSTGKPGALDNQTIRGKIKWKRGRLTATLEGDYTRTRDAAPPTTLLSAQLDPIGSLSALYNGCVQGAAPRPLCAVSPYIQYGANVDSNPNNNVPLYDNRFLTGDKDKTYATGANYSNIDNYGIGLTLAYDLSPTATIKSITAYRKLKARFGTDVDGSPLDIDQTTFAIDEHQVSQEIQLNAKAFDILTFTVGGYYFNEGALQTDFVPLGQGLLQIYGPNKQNTDNWAIFGEGNLAVTDRLSIVFGGRYTKETKKLDLNQQNLTDFFDIILPPAAFPRPDHSYLGPAGTQRLSFDNFSVRAGVNYKVTDNIFTYATFSQGFKSGGFTTRLTAPYNPDFAANSSLPSLTFQPEKANNYEIGVKTQLFDRRVRFNVAGFWNDYRNIQVVVQRGITPANENAAKGRIRGFEAELDALVTQRLRVGGSLGYLDAKYTKLDFPVGLAPFGIDAKFQKTPKWTLSGSINYTIPLEDEAHIDLNLSDSYRSTVYNDAENDAILRQGPVNQLNTSASYTFPGNKVTLTAGGKNVLNKRFIVAGFYTSSVGFAEATYNRPAEWYLRADFRF